MASDTTRGDSTEYYFISDMHIGGDEALREIAFEDELLAFLRELEEDAGDAELIVNGDAFGLWEFTELDGMAKFDALVDRYPALFEQLRATGERVPITFIPGNHDYELACYPEYVDRLAEYNVSLEREVVITREVGDRVVWIEHGQQRDPNNRSPDFGNPYANPPGYFVNRHVTSRAGKLSARGRYNWLKDIQSLTPMEEIPNWMISNYFYREMSPLLRYAALPFLLLLPVSLLFLAFGALEAAGIWALPMRLATGFLSEFGPVGVLVDAIILINIFVIVLVSIVSVPLFFLVRDVRRTLDRFGLIATGEPGTAGANYLEGAREVFDEHPEVAVFVYGHTHRASVTEVDDRVVVNTGTWLKRFHRQDVVFGLLPWVFYPSFRLNYVTIFEKDGDVVVEYRVVDKPNPHELSLLERLLTRKPNLGDPIPGRTVVQSERREDPTGLQAGPDRESSRPGSSDE